MRFFWKLACSAGEFFAAGVGWGMGEGRERERENRADEGN